MPKEKATSQYSQLSQEDLDALDMLIGKLAVQPNFITAIVRVVAKVVPVVVRITPVVTPAIAEGGRNLESYSTLDRAAARLMGDGPLTAEDLIEIRKQLGREE